MKKRILLVDAGSLRHKHKYTAMISVMDEHGVDVSNKEAKEKFKETHNIAKMPKFAKLFGKRMMTDIMHFNINNKFKIDEIVIVLEDKDNWRYELLPTYKESRKNKPSDEHFDNKAFKEMFDSFIDDVRKLLPIKVLQVPKAEGDDIIGSIVLNGDEEKEEFIILSVDKDFKQLQIHKSNVRQFTPVTPRTKENLKQGINKDAFNEVLADGYDLKYHIMFGDVADDIPHIKKGLGDKTIKKILEEENGYEKWFKKLKKAEKESVEKQYAINEQLIDLRKIPTEIQEACVKAYKETKASPFVLANALRFISKYETPFPFSIYSGLNK